MVVHILEIRRHFLGDDADVATQERVDDLAHRQHDSAQSDQALTQRKATSLHIRRPRRALEQQVFKLLDLVVESLHGVEMPVDDVIDQAVEQEPNPTPYLARSIDSSQRTTTSSRSNASSFRTVTSAVAVMKAASS